MTPRLSVGISPCPNDTFAFHAILSGELVPQGFHLDIVLADVEELNQALAAGRFDVAKGSFLTAWRLAATHGVLPVGAALGFGVGPLLLARPGLERARERLATRSFAKGPPRVLVPGAGTTARLLLDRFHPGLEDVHPVVFSEIMPALEAGRADYGVCIHEGRFTHASRGLPLVDDLGARWEETTGGPLPLGGLLARRGLPEAVREEFVALVRASLDRAWADPEAAHETMRRHAQELDDGVVRAHVDLYVNARTRELGPEGAFALDALGAAARATGLLAEDAPRLEVLGR